MLKASPELAKALNAGKSISRVSYSDCYVSSPISLLLLGEIIDTLRQITSEQWSGTALSLITGDKISQSNHRGFYGDWQDNDLKRDVCTRYFNDMGVETRVHINPLRDMPHGRFLKLVWEDDTSAVIRFDHGMGCWKIDGRPPGWFDHNAKAGDQVQRLYGAVSNLKIRFAKQYPTQIFVKVR